jgi:HCOMODA/2-hydroxy-3-carboxy-muconic semialdehyde decarboxylase
MTSEWLTAAALLTIFLIPLPAPAQSGNSLCKRLGGYDAIAAVVDDSIGRMIAATTVSLRLLYHMSAFIGEGVPVFEIRDAGGMTDMLIRDAALGRALARTLGHHPAALMRGHGAVVVGADLPLAVARSIYLELNARLQVQTIALGGNVIYLDREEVEKVVAVLDYARAWELWKRKAMAR